MAITTTLAQILAAGPCGQVPVAYANQGPNFGTPELTGWLKGLTGLNEEHGRTYGMQEPLPFEDIVRISGLDDALWCCRTRPDYNTTWRRFDAWCIEQQIWYLVPELHLSYAILLAHTEGPQEGHQDISEAHGGAQAARRGLRLARFAREKRMTLPQAVEWSTTYAAEAEFSALEIAEALGHATAPEGLYIPGEAAYHAAEAAPDLFYARRAQAAKFLELVK